MNPMEDLWEKVAQEDSSGRKLIRYKGESDLIFLYANGFVDFRKFTLKDWIDSFSASRQKDGGYKVTKEQWLKKTKYRLSEAVGEPFDPNRLKEKEITEAEFVAILKHFICPSTWIPEANIPAILEVYRTQKKLVDGKIRVDAALKKDMQEVLDRVPSPLRILQLDVARFRKKGRAATNAAVQGSKYSAGKDAQKLAAERLQQLAKAPVTKTESPKTAGISIKDLRKKTPHRV